MKLAAKHPKQMPLPLKKWGGRRQGAGRPRLDDKQRKDLPHVKRPVWERRSALHVTMRVNRRVWNLRSGRSLAVVRRSLRAGADRFDARVVQISVQGNHIHLLVEAGSSAALSRAMKGLAIRVARGMNALMGERGQVIDDSYHAHLLRSPTEVRNAMHYIRYNHRHHFGADMPAIDDYSSEGLLAGLLPAPSVWLLTTGWRRARGRPARLIE